MDSLIRNHFAQQTLVLGGALLLGVLEFVALQRSKRLARETKKQGAATAA